MRTLRIRRSAERRVGLGHLWIFSNEVDGFDKTIPAGEDVLIEDSRGRLVGTGTFNPGSLIAVRLHARDAARPLDEDLIRDRIREAWRNREAWLGKEAGACRIVFGEADGLPGLVVDRYGSHLVAQILTAAMERRVVWVLRALEEVLDPEGLVLRKDAPSRELEGLDRRVELGSGRVPRLVSFTVGDLSLQADPWTGQKTGFFFDQRANYSLIAPLARRARVLDAFCYSGAWGLHAARWGASEVVFLDASEAALELARTHVDANGTAGASFVRADAVDFLRDASATPRFDLVILDPPAFAKSRRLATQALKGYLNLNKWGFRCVRPGGYAVTCSCSHHVRPDAFVETLARAAREAGRAVRVLGVGRQAPDHPWIPAMPETAYLKALVLQVL